MKKVRYIVMPYYEVPLCECGGEIREFIDICKDDYHKAKFRCSNCNAIHILEKEDWPDIHHKIMEKFNE